MYDYTPHQGRGGWREGEEERGGGGKGEIGKVKLRELEG